MSIDLFANKLYFHKHNVIWVSFIILLGFFISFFFYFYSYLIFVFLFIFIFIFIFILYFHLLYFQKMSCIYIKLKDIHKIVIFRLFTNLLRKLHVCMYLYISFIFVFLFLETPCLVVAVQPSMK